MRAFNFHSPNHPEVRLRCTGRTDCCNNRSDEISITTYVVIIYIYSYLSKRWGEDSNLRAGSRPTNRLAICRIKPALPPHQIKNQYKKNKLIEPRCKRTTGKTFLLFLHICEIYRKGCHLPAICGRRNANGFPLGSL